MLRHPGVELAHLFGHIVDRVLRLVALEDGLRSAAWFAPYLSEGAPQGVLLAVHVEAAFHRGVRLSEPLARLDTFDLAVLSLLCVLAEKQPEEGVHQGRLARAIIAADDVRPVREADLDVPRTAEVPKVQLFNRYPFHCDSCLVCNYCCVSCYAAEAAAGG